MIAVMARPTVCLDRHGNRSLQGRAIKSQLLPPPWPALFFYLAPFAGLGIMENPRGYSESQTVWSMGTVRNMVGEDPPQERPKLVGLR